MTDHKHQDKSLGVRLSKGPNVAGREVSCWVEDFICTKCKTTTVKIVEEQSVVTA